MNSLLIAGSRNLEPQADTLTDLFHVVMDAVEWDWPNRVIHGGATGVDQAGAKWANTVIDTEASLYVAQWETVGRRAGMERNTRMVADADAAIIVWDGRSSGTKDTLRKVQKKGIPYVLLVVPEREGG